MADSRDPGYVCSFSSAFYLTGLVLALAGSAFRLPGVLRDSPHAGLCLAAALAWACATVALLTLGGRLGGRRLDRVFLAIAVGLSFLAQAMVFAAWQAPPIPTGDTRIFLDYLRALASGGYAHDNLRALSTDYDYPLWTRRAFPFHFLVYRWGGHRALVGAQMALVSLSLIPQWTLTSRLLGRHAARAAVCLVLAQPLRLAWALHPHPHIFSAFLMLWAFHLWTRSRPQGPTRGDGFLACVLLPLLTWQRGLHWVYAAVTLRLWVQGHWRVGRIKRPPLALTRLLLLPALCAVGLAFPLGLRLRQADAHQLNGGLPAFMVRGWSSRGGGEHDLALEWVDRLTPSSEKPRLHLSLLSARAAHHPRELLFRILPAKLGKLFLLGHANGLEESLALEGAWRLGAVLAGARIGFLWVALPLALWGGLAGMPWHHRRGRGLTLPAFLVVAVFVFFGESSPRYALFHQPALFALAGLGWARRLGPCHRTWLHGLPPLSRAFAHLLLAFAFLALALFLPRPLYLRLAHADFRAWAHGGEEGKKRACPHPLECVLPPRQAQTEGITQWGPLFPPPPPAPGGEWEFYVLWSGDWPRRSDAPPIFWHWQSNGEILAQGEDRPPFRLSLPAKEGARFEALAKGDYPHAMLLLAPRHVKRCGE